MDLCRDPTPGSFGSLDARNGRSGRYAEYYGVGAWESLIDPFSDVALHSLFYNYTSAAHKRDVNSHLVKRLQWKLFPSLFSRTSG